MGRSDEALADLSRAIELDPADASAFVDRGETYQAMERYEEALADFSRVIELDPEDAASAFAGRGETLRLMKCYENALADFNRAIELNPEDAWAIGSRGQTFQDMERYDLALADFNRAIELDPDLDWAIADRGETFRAMGRYGEALADYNRAIELDPGDDDYIMKRAEIQQHKGPAEPTVLQAPRHTAPHPQTPSSRQATRPPTAPDHHHPAALALLDDGLPGAIRWAEFRPEGAAGAASPHGLSYRIANRGRPVAARDQPQEDLTPVMARLGAVDLATLDALITAGVVNSRAEGLRWALSRLREDPAYAKLM
jgi:tetratricopeptide (TPR) repeat protein